MEISAKRREDHIRTACYLCHGMKFPLGTDVEFLTEELLQHIASDHLPLSCNKCSNIFHDANDLKNVEKCCETVVLSQTSEAEKFEAFDKENLSTKEQDKTEKPTQDVCENEKNLTPLTQINMRWRRKSKDFGKTGSRPAHSEGNLQRQTSTPVENLTTNRFTDSSSYSTSSIHMSSIHCSSTSSDSDGFSPPIPFKQSSVMPMVSPQRPQPQSRSRNRLPVQATPLRQVMSKSIQRAMQEHGHYLQAPYSLQQRKVSFSSSNSSNEITLNVIRTPGEVFEAALDLRMSPAIRRVSDENQAEVGHQGIGEIISVKKHIEKIEVIIRRSGVKSDAAAFNSYKSCISYRERSGSLPEFTPKLVGNNLLKKTISFEAPWTAERTPAFLIPVKQVDGEESDDDDVFYTPTTTPVKRSYQKSFSDVVIPMNDTDSIVLPSTSSDSKPRNIWSIVSSVMQLATRKSEDLTETIASSDRIWKFNFKKPEFVKRAADFFSRRDENSLEQPSKRRRVSSGNDVTTKRRGSQASPAVKRQKIQARKPLERMRNFS